VIRQWPLPPNSAFLEEICEEPLAKYIGHWARKVPAAGVGREARVGQVDMTLHSRNERATHGCRRQARGVRSTLE
jgi:hypothetical protein